MTPARHDIKIYKGALFELCFVREGFDWTGFTGTLSIRNKYSDASALIEVTTASGDLVLGSDGSVKAKIEGAVSSLITVKRGVYDLDIQDPAETSPDRYLIGEVKFFENA